MNKIGLPVTNLPSSWCIYTNRERSAQACPHFIVNTNTPGVDGVSSCGKHTKRELLQAAIPNAANVAAAAASCSQEATMATTNTGIVGCLNVLPIESQGIKFGVATISLHARVSEKVSYNVLCMLKCYHVPTIASEINVNQQGFSLTVRSGDGRNPLSMLDPGPMQRI